MKNRRNFLFGALGVLGSTALGGWLFRGPLLRMSQGKGSFDASLLTFAPEGETACVLTSTATGGPFFFPSPLRSDIREDREGIDFDFKMQLVRNNDCTPITGAHVEIWHCDAEGRYSGYPEEMAHDLWMSTMYFNENADLNNPDGHIEPSTEARYLRGRQMTDADGWVNFLSVFPGWYIDRVPHVHVRAFLPNGEEFTTQFYFPDEVCDDLYTTMEPYARYGKSEVRFKNDVVLNEQPEGNGVLLRVNHKESAKGYAGGLWATARMGVKTA